MLDRAPPLHYPAMALRLDPSDFGVASADSVAVDWPIHYAELAPYYWRPGRPAAISPPDQEDHGVEFREPIGSSGRTGR
jgi:choline dehydrogenase-like flavoprotein